MSKLTKISDYYPVCIKRASINQSNDDFLFKKPISPAPKRKCDSNQLISTPFKRFKPVTQPHRKQCTILNYWTKHDRKPEHSSSSTVPSLVDRNKVITVREFESKVNANLKIKLPELSSSVRLLKQQVPKKPNYISPIKYLEKRLQLDSTCTSHPTFEPETVSSDKAKKRLFEEAKIKISKVGNLSSFFGTVKNLIDKLSKPIYPPSSSKSIESVEKPCKFFKEKQRLKAAQLIDSSPVKQSNTLSPSNENSPPISNRSDHLALCSTYLELFRMFNRLDSMIAIMYNRQEECTFKKVKQGVEKTIKKEFTMSHLAQIVTIYPNAYQLNYERNQMTIRPNVITTKMTPYTTTSRTSEFKTNLFLFARRAHINYLASLDEPVIINDIELVRWHPSFKFPDIPEAKLPENPKKIKLNNSVNEFLHTKFNAPSPPLELDRQNVTKSSIKIKQGVLKGISQSFLDKVRNKSQQLATTLLSTTEKNGDDVKIKNLQTFIRIIHSVFANENSKSISMDRLVERCSSTLSISSNKCVDYIQILSEQLSDWLFILHTSKGKFIKINSQKKILTLCDRLHKVKADEGIHNFKL